MALGANGVLRRMFWVPALLLPRLQPARGCALVAPIDQTSTVKLSILHRGPRYTSTACRQLQTD
jgi:hypothetical protein